MAQQLSILNDPPQTLEGPRLLHELIPFKKYSSSCAIDFTSNGMREQYSYGELKSCVHALKLELQRILPTRSKPEELRHQYVIPVLIPQSPALYISQLAILESGAVFCPINLDAPGERIKFVVGDVQADIIITTSEFKDVTSWENGPKVIFVEEFPAVPQYIVGGEERSLETTHHDLAYVMYTSGSSGTPKGVAVSHLAVTQSLLAHERQIPAFKRFLQFAAPSFDVSVFEIFFPLARGATLVGCNRTQLLNDLPGMINKLDIDAAELTPTVVGSLLQTRSNVPGLKLLLTIGEMLTKLIVEEFGGSETKISMLYGMYGPTEAAIHCTIHPNMEASAKPGNIGVPLDTVSTFIAAASSAADGQDLKFLPTGEIGELVLGGPQLARGYLNRPDQNKAAFINFEGKNYYRTGDKGRQLEDGTIEILGRISAGQVKLRGQRVELGEIEEVIYKHPGIKTVCAVIPGGVLVVFALTDNRRIKSQDVLTTCAEWLPTFMVPSEIVLLQKFPYLPSGKVDKGKLGSDYQKQRESDNIDSSDVENHGMTLVRETVQLILGSFPTSMRLAAAGLDSLVAIRVASKLRFLGFEITTVAVLQADTLKSLAEACEKSMIAVSAQKSKTTDVDNESEITQLGLDPEEVERIMSCTPLQSAMLAETALDAKAYWNLVEVELREQCNSVHVLSALRDLANHNAILRTGFVESQDSEGYSQVVWKTIPNTQFEIVEELQDDFDKLKGHSLEHPLHVQIFCSVPNTKLLFHVHHGLYDAWSLELLLDDLDDILNSKPLIPRPPFRTLVDAFSDGTLVIDSWASKDYWKDHLAYLDFRQVPNFHTKRTLSTGLAVASLETSIPTAQLESSARALSSSTQSLFQAAYALILSSYLGSSDICFGTVFSGRTLPIPGIENIAGPCLSTLPVRVDVSTSTTLQELVQEINSTNRKHLEHSAVPMREIKTASGVNPREPLFDTIFIWQQTLHSYDHTRKLVHLIDSVDNLEFKLTLEIIPSTGNVVLKANYQTSLFPKSQVDMLLQQIEQATRLILRDSKTPLRDVFNHLDSKILSMENQNPQTTLGPDTLASPVEKIAAEDPERPAIDFALSIEGATAKIEHFSYSQLNARANKIAHHLSEQNALPDELVCICMEKCVDLYATILATAKLGVGYLPFTPDVAPERLRRIVQEAKVKIIVTWTTIRLLFRDIHNVTIIHLDAVDFGPLPAHNLPSRFCPENLSYCVFTSGRAGVPKGVLVTQGNLLSNLDILEKLYPATMDARLLQSCSQSLDVSVFEIFFTWRIGACLCSTTNGILYRNIENAIRVLEVTHLSLTPTVAGLINPDEVPGVEFLVTAGEAVTQRVFNSWAGRGLYQGYGPSETTNICTVNPEVSENDFINNIGFPFRNTSVFVLSPSPDFSLVPRGGEGEFCFGGSQVFRGYMNQEDNVGKIIQHPNFGRLYRSGDFGRLMPDGSLAFTGRRDDQVKIKGHRVELGEINNIMLRSPEVHDCIAMVVEGNMDNSDRLVCFWTSPTGASGSLENPRTEPAILSRIYASLSSALPAYMIPSVLIPVSYLPPTTQGKVDKQSLISHYHTLSSKFLDSIAHAPASSSDHLWTDLELTIRDALSKFAKIPAEKLLLETSFFSLGVDSISAIALSRNIRQTTQLEVEFSDILKYPSILRLAKKLLSKTLEATSMPESSAHEKSRFEFDKEFTQSTTTNFSSVGKSIHRLLPCTPLQVAMLSAAESSPSKMYFNRVILDVVGDIHTLQTSWQEMVRRHEILRTCLLRTNMPKYPFVQAILYHHDLKFGVIEGASSVSEAISTAAKHTPQSEMEPPYAMDLIKHLGSTKLLISMHHALYDGVALDILYEEVEKFFKGEPLPPALSFDPFLQAMISMRLDEADRFWQSLLGDCLPSTLLAPSQQNPESTEIQRMRIPYSLRWVEKSTQKYNTTLLAVCHAVWASIISDRVQETDICFGNVVSGRTTPIEGIDRLVAPCFNTIPSRLQNTHKLSYLEAFRKLQSINTDSVPFHLTPLRRLQSKFSPDGSRLFDTLFILQQPPRELDASIWTITEDDGTMDFPLVCEVVPRPGEDSLEIILHSHSSIVSTKDTHDILLSFSDNLKAALENPRRQLLPSLTKERIAAKLASKLVVTSRRDTDSGPFLPMTPEELALRHVISTFTDVPRQKISRDVSIFRLGLDSISTVQVAARLRRLGHKVLASEILQHPTISQLNAHLASRKDIMVAKTGDYDFAAFDNDHRHAICSKYDILPGLIEAIRPCTAVQQGMISQSLHSHGEEYINSIWLELPSHESMLKFKEAWTSAVRQHEMLRTGFAQVNDLKHPFAMVTYRKNVFELPWLESDHEIFKSATIDQLQKCPWQLSLVKGDNKSIVRFTAHHALYDAQSLQIILFDVAKACKSQPLSTPLPINQLLGSILANSQDNEARKSFWLEQANKVIINRFPELTPLRVSISKTHTQEFISQSSTSELDDDCRKIGATMQAAGQAAWARLLAAYMGENSTTFGIILSGRSMDEHSDKVAFPAIVTLPVRCDVVGTNEQLLSRTMKANASLHEHQFTPLTSIQKWAKFPGGNIFDTLFAYQKLPESNEYVDVPWKVIQEEASVDYAVSLEIQPNKSGNLTLRLTFRDDTIPVEHAGLILKQYDELLLDTVRNPKHPCDITPSIATAILSITPAKEITLPDSVELLHEFVERGARTWPNKPAFEFATRIDAKHLESKLWTYQQLNEEANKVAQWLSKCNFLPGQIIAICFDKCPEASFAILGILKAGCSYLALDPTAPMDRLRFIMADSGAKLVLAAGKPADKISAMDIEVLRIDDQNALEGCSSEPPKISRKTQPQDTSYCLYTSGTTGTPKGCLITHENAVQAMLSFQRLFAGHWTDDSKWLQFASFHFDVSVLELFWSWSVGICVASAPRDLIFEDIPGVIRELGITHIDLTPSLARLLHPNDVPSLCKGVFITGGEQLKQEILDVWGETACIYNGYGPTEATIGVTMYPRVPKKGKPSNIGPQFDNVGSFVLKPGTELPVFRGGVGELCVSGKLVGKGYLNRPDLTEERFPTLEAFNERVYRTGDLVRILHDGSFIFLGRADDQVKLRGQRLELSEINEVVKKSANCLQEVVTLVLKHIEQQKEQIVTFFVSSNDQEDPADCVSTMREASKARLPGYMVPTHFVPIKALPLNANNKADSKQLASIYNDLSVDDLQRLAHSSDQSECWSHQEQQVLDIIARAMDINASTVTSGSNIFELGLDSISIIGFARALQSAGLERARLSAVKSNTNIGALVKALLDHTANDPGMDNSYIIASQNIAAFSQKHIVNICENLGVESADIEVVAPCTPVQEGMIYRFLESKTALYFNKFEFLLDNKVDPEELFRAWTCVVARLQVTRTKFVATDDGYAQVIMGETAVNSSIDYDLAEKSKALQNPCKMAISPSSSGNTMSIQMFHGIYDGNSLTMLLRRVVDEYHGIEGDYGLPFHSSLPYGPLAIVTGAKRFWANHLQDWSYNPVHTKHESSVDTVVRKLTKSLEGFEDFRKRLRVTPQAIIQAAWLGVLQIAMPSQTTIGVVTSGRAIDFDGADKVIGPLFNTVPFNAHIESGTSMRSLITRCHEYNMKMQAFQHTPLKDIQKWSPAKPRQPLFNTLFVFQRSGAGDVTFANGVWTDLSGGQTADYPLAFEATLAADGKLSLLIVAQGSVVSPSEATGLLDRMTESLLETLRGGGANMIIAGGAQSPATSEALISYLAPNAAHDSPFTWTKEALIIRNEVVTLAKISEDTVQENSSIFELGLDSIDVIKLASRLKKQGIEIPVSAIIKSQTITKMILRITQRSDQSLRTSSASTVQGLSRDLEKYLKDQGKLPDDIMAVLPATPLQQSMINEMIKSEYQRYFNIETFELQKDADLVKLTAAIQHVIAESPILRTSFAAVDDPRSPVSFAQVVHQAHPGTSQSEAQSIDEFLVQFRVKSVRLAASAGVLFQVHFVSVESKIYMTMAICHALYDGTSLRALHKDIQEAYTGKLSPRPDFMPFLEDVFKSTTNEAKSFWKATLSNLPPSQFPQKQLSAVSEPSIIHRLERPSRISLNAIEQLCKSSHITLQTLGQTCWTFVLAHLMRQLDVAFGSVLSCRDSEDANEVMFPLMNTVAVRAVLHGSLGEMLRYMQEMGDRIREFQHFPLGMAQGFALASREGMGSIGDTRLLDTLFIYQGRRREKGNGGDGLYESVGGNAEVEFPVCVEMEVVDEELCWATACKSTARSAEETEDIIAMLDDVLGCMIANPEDPVIVSGADSISVCGLPRFRKLEAVSKPARSQMKLDEEWSTTELSIRKALHELSDVPKDMIRKHSTIFHLGLDSILILKLPALLRAYGIKLSVSDILREQTLFLMARSATVAKPSQEIVDVDAVLSVAISSIELPRTPAHLGNVKYFMPVTAGQLYMIRMWQASQGVLFWPSFEYTLKGKLDKGKLEMAWKCLLKRHDILRTGFVEIGHKVVQIVFKDPPNKVIYDDDDSSSQQSLDLRAPPVKLMVDQSGDSTTNLKLVIHHALYDGISLPLIINQLQCLYCGETIDTREISFKSFVAQSIAVSKKPSPSHPDKTLTQVQWTSYIRKSISSPPVPGTSTSPWTKRTEVVHPSLPIRPLKQQAQDAGVTIDALLLAAAAKTYSKRQRLATHASSIVIGMYLANRAVFGEDLAAPTLNLLPIAVQDPVGRGLEELARDIQRDVTMIGGPEMVCASLEEICRWTGVRVDFFVNILKDSGSNEDKVADEDIFMSRQDLTRRAVAVENEINRNMGVQTDERCGDYLPSVDVEIRYSGDKIDIGVFAPNGILSVDDAEGMIDDFMKVLV